MPHDVELCAAVADVIGQERQYVARHAHVALGVLHVLAERELDVDVRSRLDVRHRRGQGGILVVAAAAGHHPRTGIVDLYLGGMRVGHGQGGAAGVLGAGADAEVEVAAVGVGGSVEALVDVRRRGGIGLALAASERRRVRDDAELLLGRLADLVLDFRTGA